MICHKGATTEFRAIFLKTMQKWLGEQEKIIYLSGSVAHQSRLLKNKMGIYFSGSATRWLTSQVC